MQEAPVETKARPVSEGVPAPRDQNFVDMLPKITVMGVGGGGCNALNNMIQSGSTPPPLLHLSPHYELNRWGLQVYLVWISWR